MGIASGIYKIYNTINDKTYIGSTQNLKRRLKDHKVYLRTGKSPSTHLQNAYNKYGVDAFQFEVIEYCEINKLAEREQFWVDTIPKNKRYNQRVIVESNRGYKFSEQSREKLKGRTVWNKGLRGVCPVTAGCIKKGERISIKTEFKKGVEPWNKGKKGLQKEDVIMGKRRKISFRLVSPDNILYEGVCLKWFTDEMGIHYSNLQRVVSKKYGQQKGWRLPNSNDVYEGYGTFIS